jgi:hypothetical protein
MANTGDRNSVHEGRKIPENRPGEVAASETRREPYVDCDWCANAERSQAPRKIFERGALWQYKG